MERRRFRFKVPANVKSRKQEQKSYVEFKNLTDHLVLLYWIDFESKPKFFGELKPINRNDVGLRILTFVTHPWLVVYGKKQASLNGKRYFSPPLPFWKDHSNGWLNKQWNLLKPRLELEAGSSTVLPVENSSGVSVATVESNSDVNVATVESNSDVNVATVESSSTKDVQQYYEVLILLPECMDLKKLCLIRLLEVLGERSYEDLDIPKTLKSELKRTKEQYFLFER